MTRSTIVLLFLAATFAACTKRAYVPVDVASQTADHTVVAVLPYDVVYTGRQPAKLSEAQLAEKRRTEALAFQQDLIDRILHRATGKRQLTVDLQSAEQTNARLAKAGIAVEDLGEHTIADLIAALDVDAVVVAEVTKHRQLSTIESAAADVLATVLNNPSSDQANRSLNRTYLVDLHVRALNARGDVLYSDSDNFSLDYRRNVNVTIEQVNRRLIKRFPYIMKS